MEVLSGRPSSSVEVSEVALAPSLRRRRRSTRAAWDGSVDSHGMAASLPPTATSLHLTSRTTAIAEASVASGSTASSAAERKEAELRVEANDVAVWHDVARCSERSLSWPAEPRGERSEEVEAPRSCSTVLNCTRPRSPCGDWGEDWGEGGG